MFDVSPVQILLVLGIALLVLGPKRLPGMAKSLGHGLRGFRDSFASNDESTSVPMGRRWPLPRRTARTSRR